MKIVGLLVVVLGWLIAVSSTQVSGAAPQLILALIGLLTSAGGVIGILNQAHLNEAIWTR